MRKGEEGGVLFREPGSLGIQGRSHKGTKPVSSLGPDVDTSPDQSDLYGHQEAEQSKLGAGGGCSQLIGATSSAGVEPSFPAVALAELTDTS